MTSTDTTTTAAAAAPANSFATELATLKTKLSADWQTFIAFFENEEANAIAFVKEVEAGVAKGVEDVIDVGQYIAGKTSIINAGATALAATDPNSSALQKVAADIQAGSADLVALAHSLTSGSTAGDNAIVTSAANGIGAVQQLTGLLSAAVSAVATSAASAPGSTQTVSPATPNEG